MSPGLTQGSADERLLSRATHGRETRTGPLSEVIHDFMSVDGLDFALPGRRVAGNQQFCVVLLP
jgi:hypothetical protein